MEWVTTYKIQGRKFITFICIFRNKYESYISRMYLVISASALTYIINQTSSNITPSLYIDEYGSCFKKAVIINDWWNIPHDFAKVYTHDVRNNETISDTLESLCDNWT